MTDSTVQDVQSSFLTVGQLIEKLQKCDQDAIISIGGDNAADFQPVFNVEEAAVIYNRVTHKGYIEDDLDSAKVHAVQIYTNTGEVCQTQKAIVFINDNFEMYPDLED